MNDERDRTTADQLVSDTYREVADERAPQSLNDKVLRMAAGAKPPRSLIPGPWMKPVAWAATIGLSLAIVLELTQVAQTPPGIDGISPSVSTDEPGTLVPASNETLSETELDDHRDRQDQPEKSAIAEPLDVTESQDRPRERRDVKPEVHRAEMPVTEEAAAQAITHAPELREATVTADGQTVTDADDGTASRANNAAAVPSMALRTEKMLVAEPLLCPTSVRESADEWYRCIETIRASSSAEAIDREIGALRKQFPDYPIPDTDK